MTAQLQRRHLIAIGAATLALACTSSSSSTIFTGPLILTGTYLGEESGVNGGVGFEQEFVQFTLVHEGDSLVGSWAGAVGAGSLEGTIDDSNGSFDLALTMTQDDPCPGSHSATAEARLGTQFDGSTTIGIAGSYSGTSCDGDVQSDFFVQLAN